MPNAYQTLMETRLLQMFGALAETLHFGQAAHRLGITQPALSRGIQKLEQDLQVQLFFRDSRNVRLTPAGEAFRSAAHELVERAEEAVRAARTAGKPSAGVLVLGVGLSACQPPVGRLVQRFRAAHPDYRVSLKSLEEHQMPQALGEQTVHAVVAVDWALPSGCNRRPLFDTELRMAVPSGSPLADREQVGPQDLDALQVIVPCRREQPMIFDRFQEYCRNEAVEPELTIDVQTLDQLLGVVSGGAAAAVVPAPEGMAYPGVVFKPVRPRYPLQYCLGWRRDSELLRKLVDCV